jgi:predicted transcriptional regulator
MKSVLISIQPKWCELIANGKKTVEVRKTRPKLETPFKVYIYCTNWKDNTYWKNHYKDKLGKVIGEFVCEKIDRIGKRGIHNNFNYCYLSLNEWGNDDIEIEITDIKKSCISKAELNLYGANCSCLNAWHISNLVIYDKPRELDKFKRFCDGVSGKIGCRGCKYYYEENDESQGHFEMCGCDNLRPLIRPPQSWCYVESGVDT